MNRNSIHYQQAQLLIRVLPFVAKESCFALKGGTAINLFVRNMPRLSVDIDLVYLPLEDRETSLKMATDALDRISKQLAKDLPGLTAQRPKMTPDGLRLLVIQDGVQVKLEVSPVLRGTVFPPAEEDVCERVESEFGFAAMPVVSFEDLFAGKICAALDRQHPRDLFDIKLLLDHESISDVLRRTFLVYLISHHRPIVDLLQPNFRDIRTTYANEFAGMTSDPVVVGDLEAAREQLVTVIHQGLTSDDKRFLLSFKAKEPKWDLLGLNGIANLPAVKWKLMNLERMSAKKHQLAFEKLKRALKVAPDSV